MDRNRVRKLLTKILVPLGHRKGPWGFYLPQKVQMKSPCIPLKLCPSQLINLKRVPIQCVCMMSFERQKYVESCLIRQTFFCKNHTNAPCHMRGKIGALRRRDFMVQHAPHTPYIHHQTGKNLMSLHESFK